MGNPVSAIRVITSGDGTASYVVSNDIGGSPVVLAGPFATAAEALKATKTPF
jgi:hypothetical protein